MASAALRESPFVQTPVTMGLAQRQPAAMASALLELRHSLTHSPLHPLTHLHICMCALVC